jgi:glycosyltransferase involved in cell wall biosynthesis
MTREPGDHPDPEQEAPSHRLHFYPDYRASNPFQTMLHAALAGVGAEAVPVANLADHLRTRAEGPGDPGLLSLHWSSPILSAADGPFRARLLLDRFATLLDGFLDAGGRLVWTVHNILPHELRHRWAEIELAQLLADRADLIHVLSAQTPELVEPFYHLDPAKVVVVEHASYAGCYPDSMSRADARSRLGLGPEHAVLVTLGGIRPYKALDTLLDVFDELARDDDALRLLIAGRVSANPMAERLRERCAGDDRVTALFEHVADDDVQVWMKAADVAVLPYRDILNSGAFLLAQTFGLPVVAPRAGSLRTWEDQPQVSLFDPQDPASLASAVTGLLAEVRRDPDRLREHALEAARSRLPETMASGFAQAIAPLLPPRASVVRRALGRPGSTT